MAKQKFRTTRPGGFSGAMAYIRYVEVLKKHRNAVGRTFCDAINISVRENKHVEELKNSIRDILDFPKKGIVFKDITTLLEDGRHFHRAIDLLAHRYLGQHIDKIVGVEARGFILGSALAYKLGTGISLVRKPGKLPHKTIQKTYDLEYGTDTLEIHADAFKPGERVIIADDLLATGGTIAATVDLVRQLDADIVECAFLAELDFLHGRDKLLGVEAFSLLHF